MRLCPTASDPKSQLKNEAYLHENKNYRKIPKISPSMYKLLQIEAPQTGNAKNPLFNRPSKYKPPGGLYLENCPQIQSKTKQKR